MHSNDLGLSKDRTGKGKLEADGKEEAEKVRLKHLVRHIKFTTKD